MTGEELEAIIKETGYDINTFSERLGITRQTLSRYINKDCVPEIAALAAKGILYEKSMEAIERSIAENISQMESFLSNMKAIK